MLEQYAPLHVHSDASSDGLGTVQALVKYASECGFKSLALTDHGTLANAVTFWSACEDYKIKPILGVEAYFVYDGIRRHLTLLSKSRTGFNKLIDLCTAANANLESGYPVVTMKMLEDHWHSDMHILTGCPASAIHSNDIDYGSRFVADLVAIVGRKNVDVEVMFVGTHDVWGRPLAIAEKLNLPYVVTNDTHFARENQAEAHKAIVKARKGYTYESHELWLKCWRDITLYGSRWVPIDVIEAGLRRTNEIAGDVVSWSMRAEPRLPHVEDAESILRAILKKAFEKDISDRPDAERVLRKERLQREFHVFKSRSLIDYLYILNDVVFWAKSKGIRVGPGRGSGAGSYILYLLGITSVDPIRWGLLFERFLSATRTDYPDVDVDFDSERRNEVLEYTIAKWGAVGVATYNTYNHKSAVHDLARVFHVDKEFEIPAAERGPTSEEFGAFVAQNENIGVTYDSMIGQIRHRGKHAGGVIITDVPVPRERVGETMVAAWSEGHNKDLSRVGIVKYDFLGVTALTQIQEMADISGDPAPTEPDDDPLILDLFCKGKVSGIFQWTGSEGIRNLTMRVAPKSFRDLVTINALYRPGALSSGMADEYPKLEGKPRLLHPRIDGILAETRGVICYQEQVMAIFAEVTGGDLSYADEARRLIVKSKPDDAKWIADIETLKRHFIERGLDNGFDHKVLDKLWLELFTHSGYSYNLSHATAYSIISWQMAFYKVYHPIAFYCAMIHHDSINIQQYIIEGIERGLSFNTPDINYSNEKPTLEGSSIYMPLVDVKGIGEKSIKAIVEERERNGPFVTFADFAKRIGRRVCNNTIRNNFLRLGVFSSVSGDPKDAMDVNEFLIEDSVTIQQDILGYFIPSATLIRNIRRHITKDTVAGVVMKIHRKEGKFGEYHVVYLAPEGSFWTRGSVPAVGDALVVKKSKFGSAMKITPLEK